MISLRLYVCMGTPSMVPYHTYILHTEITYLDIWLETDLWGCLVCLMWKVGGKYKYLNIGIYWCIYDGYNIYMLYVGTDLPNSRGGVSSPLPEKKYKGIVPYPTLVGSTKFTFQLWIHKKRSRKRFHNPTNQKSLKPFKKVKTFIF
jgi:hypothetical protein